MKGKSLLTIVAASLLTYSTIQAQEIASITSPLSSADKSLILQEPVLLQYKLIEHRKGKDKEIGEASIRESSIEGRIKKFVNMRVRFTQENDSTYQERFGVKSFGEIRGEVYDYAKHSDVADTISSWNFDEYAVPIISNKKKEDLIGSSYPDSINTQLDLFRSLLEGSLDEKNATLFRGLNYDLDILVNEEIPSGTYMQFKITETSDDDFAYYFDHPIDVYLNHQNIPIKIDAILTHENKNGEKSEIYATMKLEDANYEAIERLLEK